jgi:hypothetical protein
MMIDKLTGIRCNNNKYLCELNETDGKVELFNACLWQESYVETITLWITKQNLGEELQTIRLGKSTGYEICPLDLKQKKLLQRLWEDMQEIKKTAVRRLENGYFMENRQ